MSTEQDLASLLEGLGLDAIEDFDTHEDQIAAASPARDCDTEQEVTAKVARGATPPPYDDIEAGIDGSVFQKALTAPGALPTFGSMSDPWLQQQATLSALLTLPTAPMQPMMQQLDNMLLTPQLLQVPPTPVLAAEQLEEQLMLGMPLGYSGGMQPASNHNYLQKNPLMQQPVMPDQEHDEEQDQAAGGKKKRRRRRKPKKDRRDDPSYWASRPASEQCMIIPIQDETPAG